MKKKGKFVHMDLAEFGAWLSSNKFYRRINMVQNHHTYIPNYSHFNGSNHFALCESMERSHLQRGFAEIAQNITSFPDGTLVLCRDFNTIPAGIKGANSYGICIEHVGNFDTGGDAMNNTHREAIVNMNALLLKRFTLRCDAEHVVYHHWWDLVTGKRTNGTGTTKSCPGTAFFGGNSVQAAEQSFFPLIAAAMGVAPTPSAPPAPLFQGEVTASSLRVRDAADSNGAIVGSVARGAEVSVFEERNGWCRVHPTASRWVSARYVARL